MVRAGAGTRRKQIVWKKANISIGARALVCPATSETMKRLTQSPQVLVLQSSARSSKCNSILAAGSFSLSISWSLCFLSGSACSINSLMEFVVMSDVLDWVPFGYDPTAVFFCFIPLIKRLHHPCTNLSIRCQTWAAFNARLTPTLVNIAFKIFLLLFYLFIYLQIQPYICIYTHTTSPDYFDDLLNWM